MKPFSFNAKANRLLLSLSVSLSVSLSTLLAQPLFVKDSLDLYVAREMQRQQVPGLAVAIVKDGKVVVCKGYGVQSLSSKKPVDAQTLFQIASNSKAFTGTAIAQLHKEKKLDLDAKVTQYLPDFQLYDPTSTQLCTVRDLLCHRIGHGTFQGDYLNWGSNLSRKEIVFSMRNTVPKNQFRYTYGYCNAAYITAGEIILAQSGKTWDEYIRTQYFEPLGMVHTNTSFSAMKADANACAPHTLYRGKLVQMELTNIDNMSASAAVNSCVADMSRWLLMQLDSGRYEGKQIVPMSVLNETRRGNMISSDAPNRLFPGKHFATYGLGWNSYSYKGRRFWEHSGGANGFVTKTEFCPEEQLGVIVYTNSDENSLYEALTKQIIEAYLNVPYRNISATYHQRQQPGREKEWKELDSLQRLANKKPEPSVPLAAFIGKYNHPLYGMMEIKLGKNALTMHLSHHPNNIAKLEYLGDNKFLCTYSDLTCGVQVLPFKAEGDKVKTLDVKVNDFIDYEWYTFTKLP